MTEKLAEVGTWPWIIGIAMAIWGLALTLDKAGHLSPDARASLSLWLKGDYESTWAANFCYLFNRVFTDKHWTLRCFMVSTVSSLVCVLVTYLFITQGLGIDPNVRLDSKDISVWHLLLLGAGINVIPDYLSLYTTRVLLRIFNNVTAVYIQVSLLFLDAVLKALIILFTIAIWRALNGLPQLSFVELVGLFSLYSIFFYSTFLTAVWAWTFCVSSWFVRLFSKTPLKLILNIDEKPVSQIGLVSALLIGVVLLVVSPALTKTSSGITKFDEYLCNTFPADACELVATRLTKDQRIELSYLIRACEGGAFQTCLDAARNSLFGEDPSKASLLLENACNNGDLESCLGLAGLLRMGSLGIKSDPLLARKLYRRVCEKGLFEACIPLASMYMDVQGTPQANSQVETLLQRSCDNGESFGCIFLAHQYDTREPYKENARTSFVRDQKKAFNLYQQACELNNPGGCKSLADSYLDGLGVTKDVRLALKYNGRACDLGDVPGCVSLADQLAQGEGITRDMKKAIELYQKACDSGDLFACMKLGDHYHDGNGVNKNYTIAAKLYRLICDKDKLYGCTQLSRLYEDGKGVIQSNSMARSLLQQACQKETFDDKVTLKLKLYNCRKLAEFDRTIDGDEGQVKLSEWLAIVCEGGHSNGCFELAQHYESGEELEKYLEQVVDLYTRACNGGIGKACTMLGRRYLRGEGVQKSEKQAISLFRQACDNKELLGCAILGRRYETGGGVRQDMSVAIELYTYACDGGHLAACVSLGRVFWTGKSVPKDRLYAKKIFGRACERGYYLACNY